MDCYFGIDVSMLEVVPDPMELIVKDTIDDTDITIMLKNIHVINQACII